MCGRVAKNKASSKMNITLWLCWCAVVFLVKVIRHDQTQEQATLFYSGYVMDKEVKALPFIKMKSLGSGDEFNLSIRRKSAVLDNAESSFSTYGFNRQAALPKF